MISPNQKLAAAITRVVGVDAGSSDPKRRGIAPYFGAVLRGLVRCETPGEGTMSVSEHGVLYWDPAFVVRIRPEELAGALIHEVMHVVLKHIDRGKALGVVPTATDNEDDPAYRWNIAADLAINPAVKEMAPLPPGGVFPEHYGFVPGQTMEVYYRLLRKQAPKPQQQGGGGGGGAGGGAGGPQPSGGRAGGAAPGGQRGVGSGWCGSCAGHPRPCEPKMSNGDSKPEYAGRSQAELDRMRRQVANDIQEAVEKRRGTVPSELQRWAAEQLAPPKIPWREKLARTVRGAVAYKSGASDLTFNRVSRRQAGVGFGFGRPIVPALHAPIPDAAVVIDTSGSMGASDLGEAGSETQGVLAALGVPVTIVTIDAAVHGLKEVRTIKEAMSMLKGGGGTNMAPAFAALAKRKSRPSVVIVMTDGHIGSGHPATEPSWCKTIWVVIGRGGNAKPCPWGEVVVLDDIGEGRKTA